MRNLDRIKYLIYHCTGSSQRATMKGIMNHWRETMRWIHGGYQILIFPDGTAYFYNYHKNSYSYEEDFSYFRGSLHFITNGVSGYNSNSIHMSYVGGATGDDRTPQQKATMYNLTKQIIDILPNKIDILGHRDLSKDLNGNGIITPDEWSKICPSFDVIDWMNKTGLYNYLLSKN